MSRQVSSTWLDHHRVNGTCSCPYLLGSSVSHIERGRFYQWDTTDDHKSFFFSPKSETSLESFSPCQVSSPNICTCVPVKSHNFAAIPSQVWSPSLYTPGQVKPRLFVRQYQVESRVFQNRNNNSMTYSSQVFPGPVWSKMLNLWLCNLKLVKKCNSHRLESPSRLQTSVTF